MLTLSFRKQDGPVIQRLQNLPGALDTAVATGLARGLQRTIAVAQLNYLSGPRPGKLDVRTQRLRNSISAEVEKDSVVVAIEANGGATFPVTRGSGDIIGRIGSNVEYAAFHEFGFHGIINVKAHARVISTLDVAGNPIDQRRRVTDKSGKLIGYKESRAAAAAKTGSRAAFVFQQNVRAHGRHVDYAGRPYIRPALEETLPTITAEISREIKLV
jgi:phage gpG-like protein